MLGLISDLLYAFFLPPTASCMTSDMSEQHAAVTQVHNAPKRKSNQICKDVVAVTCKDVTDSVVLFEYETWAPCSGCVLLKGWGERGKKALKIKTCGFIFPHRFSIKCHAMWLACGSGSQRDKPGAEGRGRGGGVIDRPVENCKRQPD